MKQLFRVFLTILLFSLMTAKYKEIEYRQRILNMYNKSYTLFSVKFNRENGIEAKYETGKVEFKLDAETMSLKETTTPDKLKSFNLKNEELELMETKKLFKNFDKIKFPKKTDFTSALYPDFPIWHIIVDGKDYQSNVDTDFYTKIDGLVNIKKIRDYVVNNFDN